MPCKNCLFFIQWASQFFVHCHGWINLFFPISIFLQCCPTKFKWNCTRECPRFKAQEVSFYFSFHCKLKNQIFSLNWAKYTEICYHAMAMAVLQHLILFKSGDRSIFCFFQTRMLEKGRTLKVAWLWLVSKVWELLSLAHDSACADWPLLARETQDANRQRKDAIFREALVNSKNNVQTKGYVFDVQISESSQARTFVCWKRVWVQTPHRFHTNFRLW